RDIHGRRRGSHGFSRWTWAVVARAEEFIQHVVLISCDDETINGQAHLTRDVAGANITKVAGRHRKRHLLICGIGDLEPAVDVVDNLRHQSRPVNGVDGTNAVVSLKLCIGRDRLDHVLAVIKDTIEGDVENIWVIESKHLCLLEGSHASSWGE